MGDVIPPPRNVIENALAASLRKSYPSLPPSIDLADAVIAALSLDDLLALIREAGHDVREGDLHDDPDGGMWEVYPNDPDDPIYVPCVVVVPKEANDALRGIGDPHPLDYEAQKDRSAFVDGQSRPSDVVPKGAKDG